MHLNIKIISSIPIQNHIKFGKDFIQLMEIILNTGSSSTSMKSEWLV